MINLRNEKRPVLIGTTSVEISELLSKMLNRNNVNHNVLNAKLHKFESEIIAQAGNLSQITIATNMAGRGTDIILGGNLEFFTLKKTIEIFKNNINKHENFFFLKGNTITISTNMKKILSMI